MESSASRRPFVYLIAAIALTAVVIGIIVYRQLPETPLTLMVKPGLPMLDTIVKLRNLEGEDLSPEGARIGDAREAPQGDERCAALIGGDSSASTTLSDSEKRPGDCPRIATWYVKQHPIALSLYFEDGAALLNWYDRQPQVQAWVANRFVQGLFYGLLHSIRIKAEDLDLQGLQGELLAKLLREAIAAHGQLHYDMVHGNQGWVLSFVRNDSAFAAKALPVMAAALARNGYKLAKLPNPVLEMNIGLQRLFLTQYQDRIYLALSLEALLNVMESLTPPGGGIPSAPLSLTLRAEAFVDKLLPVMAGSSSLDMTWSFALKDGKLGVLSVPSGPWVRQLHAHLYDGVLAAIPHDTFAAVAASFQVPATLTQEDWRKLATEGPGQQAAGAPEDSGFAVLWDFDGKNSPNGAIGIVVANQTDPEASAAYQQYLRDADLSAQCAGGALFLAASSERLLARMKEACAHQSLSPLDWEQGHGKQRYTSAQLMSFINPGVGLRELFLAGGAGAEGDAGDDFAPRWKQDYEKAKAAMRGDGDILFGSLPIFAYAGRAGTGKTITLEGYAVNQGTAQ
ncbi:hypothetical protein F6R98_08555 [Candidatus Methylospira mobilis]|uniref:Uncharacterized protein n=1 Tax=Candidatus Methylospira mobilis TaxID=1808979 RepID=A0A5Q0BGK6_9GAMM|nr:hypothetical protein [Candidatus Methylospira mobilis]QFY42669.1 hypothetical protein F6R98_08555 [Candidatus Methylospira mobilis]WNV04213.1 hypothetical protein RP726_17660 [Candidatus Methylospira mobilis]